MTRLSAKAIRVFGLGFVVDPLARSAGGVVKINSSNPVNQIHSMKLPGSHRPVKGKCGAKLIKESSPHLKPINKIPRLIRTATAVIVAGGLAVMVLSAQDDLDTVRQAAEQGDATAQFNLGNMYATGEGVPQDDPEAARWFRLAAEQGLASAQFNLGVMCANGEGVPKDNAEAVRWYRLAAEQGLANAQFMLGNMYASGRGVLEDDAEAVRWYRLAAEQTISKPYHSGINATGSPRSHHGLRRKLLGSKQAGQRQRNSRGGG